MLVYAVFPLYEIKLMDKVPSEKQMVAVSDGWPHSTCSTITTALTYMVSVVITVLE